MKILVLGSTGMLGSAVFRAFQSNKDLDVWGTLRNTSGLTYFPAQDHIKLISDIDVLDQDILLNLFEKIKPDVVINCVGLIKQLSSAKDPLVILPINSILPHRLAKLCSISGSRLVHISTDCVFSGIKGLYTESDISDAVDLYGKSKFIGELSELPHVITLRTSIIGHELNSNYSLIDWFLSQSGAVKGYINAIYSGLPTVELARVIMDFVIPRPDLTGLYHVASKPINKYELLKLVAEVYGKEITITPDDKLFIDRSLNGNRFRDDSGYIAPEWPQLVEMMHKSRSLSGVN